MKRSLFAVLLLVGAFLPTQASAVCENHMGLVVPANTLDANAILLDGTKSTTDLLFFLQRIFYTPGQSIPEFGGSVILAPNEAELDVEFGATDSSLRKQRVHASNLSIVARYIQVRAFKGAVNEPPKGVAFCYGPVK